MNNTAPVTWSVGPTPVHHPDAHAVLWAYLDELISRYYGRPADGAEIVHEMGDGSDLVGEAGVLLLARDGDGEVVGCAGVRWLEAEVAEVAEVAEAEVAELTRVYVVRQARRGGGGRQLLAAAERVAYDRGVRRMLLNTRQDLTEAIALYERLGYRHRAPYGDDPYAQVWMEKLLTGDQG